MNRNYKLLFALGAGALLTSCGGKNASNTNTNKVKLSSDTTEKVESDTTTANNLSYKVEFNKDGEASDNKVKYLFHDSGEPSWTERKWEDLEDKDNHDRWNSDSPRIDGKDHNRVWTSMRNDNYYDEGRTIYVPFKVTVNVPESYAGPNNIKFNFTAHFDPEWGQPFVQTTTYTMGIYSFGRGDNAKNVHPTALDEHGERHYFNDGEVIDKYTYAKREKRWKQYSKDVTLNGGVIETKDQGSSIDFYFGFYAGVTGDPGVARHGYFVQDMYARLNSVDLAYGNYTLATNTNELKSYATFADAVNAFNACKEEENAILTAYQPETVINQEINITGSGTIRYGSEGAANGKMKLEKQIICGYKGEEYKKDYTQKLKFENFYFDILKSSGAEPIWLGTDKLVSNLDYEFEKCTFDCSNDTKYVILIKSGGINPSLKLDNCHFARDNNNDLAYIRTNIGSAHIYIKNVSFVGKGKCFIDASVNGAYIYLVGDNKSYAYQGTTPDSINILTSNVLQLMKVYAEYDGIAYTGNTKMNFGPFDTTRFEGERCRLVNDVNENNKDKFISTYGADYALEYLPDSKAIDVVKK